VAQLRKKVEAVPDEPRTILTVHGVGYRLDA
jgi:DNA-binding response OmpR family regulator